MNQIELGTKPEKNQPIFSPGAGQRVASWLAVLFFVIGVSVSVEYLFGSAIRYWAGVVTKLVFS